VASSSAFARNASHHHSKRVAAPKNQSVTKIDRRGNVRGCWIVECGRGAFGWRARGRDISRARYRRRPRLVRNAPRVTFSPASKCRPGQQKHHCRAWGNSRWGFSLWAAWCRSIGASAWRRQGEEPSGHPASRRHQGRAFSAVSSPSSRAVASFAVMVTAIMFRNSAISFCPWSRSHSKSAR
jgi:hypothetical protein